jgi:23S rRNA pseudouridine2605 synthase
MADAIKQGKVEVNGAVVTDFRHPVNSKTDRVSFDSKDVVIKPRQHIYIVLNKPKGVITTVSDDRRRKTVLDSLPEKYRGLRLFPVGRLDKESTGLLLLTNDGELTYRLTHPRFEHEKEYLLQIDGKLKIGEKRMLESGIELDEGKTAPAVIKEANLPTFNYSITIHEGKKRQVHRMFAAIGHRVIVLKRIRMGSLGLGDLKEGKARELTAREISRVLTETSGRPQS